MITIKRETNSGWYIVVILIACFLILWPLLKHGFVFSDDGEWMVIRLSAFYQSLREGQFPVRYLGRLNNSYGYPVANFLYPGFLYIGSFVHILGMSFPDAVKIIFGFSVVGASLAIFYWLKTHFDDHESLVAALGFIFAPYLIFDLYQRGSVGEVFVLFPLAVGLYCIASGKRFFFPIAVLFVVIGHNTMGMLAVLVFLSYIFVQRKIDFFVPFLIGIGLAAFFWMPALLERHLVKFNSLILSRPTSYFLQGLQLELLGITGVLAFIFLLLRKQISRLPHHYWFIIWFTVCIFLATRGSTFLWNWKILSQLVQFPYRFLAIEMVIATWFIAALIDACSPADKRKVWILFLLIWIIYLVPALSKVQIVERPLGFYTTNEATTTVADEYLPEWVAVNPDDRAAQPLEIYQGHGLISITSASTQHIEARIETTRESVIQINKIYYPGWGILLNGVPQPIDYNNLSGLIRVRVPAGAYQLSAEFHETFSRFLADLVSFVSGSVYIIYLIGIRLGWVSRENRRKY